MWSLHLQPNCSTVILYVWWFLYRRVFGAGYPSLATMSVNEWYDQHRQKGCLPDQGIPRSTGTYLHLFYLILYFFLRYRWWLFYTLALIYHVLIQKQNDSVRMISFTVDGDAEEDERAERERKEENDDEEALQKARDWDDWKDTHRRGYGNRKNMGWSDTYTDTCTHRFSSPK